MVNHEDSRRRNEHGQSDMEHARQGVLAHNGKWTGVATHLSESEWTDEHWQDERHEFIEMLGPKVTHWMPLPPPPTEQP